jgi:tetratricopeptide (TPR) repeat protein
VASLANTRVVLARADALMTQGRIDEAIAQYREVVRAEPNDSAGYNKLGGLLMRRGQARDALATIRRAVELKPDDPEAHNNLGLALMQVGQFQDAVSSMQRAVELKPDYAEARYNLAQAFSTLGQAGAAVGQLREALRLKPDWPPALMSLAWLEATEDDAVRNPEEAVRLASRAVELNGDRDAQGLDVLAAAYAAAGRFEEARRTAEAAEALAAGSAPDFAAQIRARLNIYRAGKPLVNTGR